MNLETVFAYSVTMGSAKTGGDTFIVLKALSRIISLSPGFHDMLIVGFVSLLLALCLPRAEIDWSGRIISFSMVILVRLPRVYFRRKPE